MFDIEHIRALIESEMPRFVVDIAFCDSAGETRRGSWYEWKGKMSARAVHSPLHLDFDVTFCPAAAGQNFVRLNKGQRLG